MRARFFCFLGDEELVDRLVVVVAAEWMQFRGKGRGIDAR